MQPAVATSGDLSPTAPWSAPLGSRRRRSHSPDVQVLHRQPPWRTLAPLSAWLLFTTSGLSVPGVDQDSSFNPGHLSFAWRDGFSNLMENVFPNLDLTDNLPPVSEDVAPALLPG